MSKRYNLFLLIILCIVIGILIGALYVLFSVKYVKEYEMSLFVGKYLGIDTNTSAITFGMVREGAGSKREIFLTNHLEYPVRVYNYKYGNISRFVSFSHNNFILKANETIKMAVIASPAGGTPEGKYTGRMVTVFLKD